ncbi:MAG TPA: ankyrin repeat domain-containing protein, partial [Candidatus Dependentiae bacterium]|nr:ankyrin repeat domain-containing protein [Candidatus Dependentiae bacterium]
MKKTKIKIFFTTFFISILVYSTLGILLLFYFNGHTPLTFAARYDQPQAIKLLLKNGANIDHQEKNGLTALTIAASNGHLKVVELLLENKANIDHQEKHGCTALILAAYGDHLKVV